MNDRNDRHQDGRQNGDDVRVEELVRQLHDEVGDALQTEQTARTAAGRGRLSGDDERMYARKLIGDAIRGHVADRFAASLPSWSPETEQILSSAVYARMYGAGALQPLLDDPEIENIDINSPDEVFLTYADGRKVQAPAIVSSDDELIKLVQTLGSYAGRSSRAFDAANPELDLRLPDGSRLSAVQGVSAHPALSIRRHRLMKVELPDLIGNGTLSPEAADFLAAAVRARANLMIAGATNSGKTTLLRALATEIDPMERLITVERSLELGLGEDHERHPNILELEERLANSEGAGQVTMAQLVRRTLRQNPDRVIVGEVLGDEIITMLNAMSQGNDGSLSTIHARSAREVFNRIATYAIQSEEALPHEATYSLIAGALDFIVYLERDAATGRRHLVEIRQINGYDSSVGVSSSGIFEPADQVTPGAPEGDYRAVRCTDVSVQRSQELAQAGWVDPATTGGGWS